jgi:hypothetical protein
MRISLIMDSAVVDAKFRERQFGHVDSLFVPDHIGYIFTASLLGVSRANHSVVLLRLNSSKHNPASGSYPYRIGTTSKSSIAS